MLRMFMWGYQPHFRNLLQHTIEPLLERAGARLTVNAVLVGILRPGGQNSAQATGQSGLPVCIEPERGLLVEGDFDGLPDEIENRIQEHPNQQLMYVHEHIMREKPERIRKLATYEAVQDRLKKNDLRNGFISIMGSGAVIGQYHVFPILRFRESEWSQYIPLSRSKSSKWDEWIPRSLIETLAYQVLNDALVELSQPDAGRNRVGAFERDSADALRRAGKSFMYVAELAGNNMQGQGVLFDYCNMISSLRYEGSAGGGQMIVARENHPDIIPQLKLKQPIRLREAAWARKVLQIASHDLALLCDSAEIRGLGQLNSGYKSENEDLFIVRFVGHYKWELVHASRILMRVEYGVPTLPADPLEESYFKREASRLLKEADSTDVNELWRIVATATEQKHGTMIVVATNAAEEAVRLSMQATPIEPTRLSTDNIRRVTSIDGAVLLDQTGVCHAIGVILDGRASPNGTPSRGARYNSAVRYIETASNPVLAVVISEDGYIDFLPRLNPQIPKDTITNLISTGRQAASAKNWDQLEDIIRNLSIYRFYIKSDELGAANELLEQWHARPRDPFEIILDYPRFEVNHILNELYFTQ